MQESAQEEKYSQPIVDISFKLAQYDKRMQMGHSTVPFALTLPDWLPESAILKDRAINLAVLYFITAQLDPRQEDLFADQKSNVSLCRDERVIYIYNEKIDYSKQVEGDT